MDEPLVQVQAAILHRLRTHQAALRMASQALQHDHDNRLPRMIDVAHARADEARECLELVAAWLPPGWAAPVPDGSPDGG